MLNRELSEQLKLDGMGQACSPHFRHALLEHCRFLAESHATQHGTVTAEDVRTALEREGRGNEWEMLGNAAGHLFRNGEFVPTGEHRKSGHTSRHSGLLAVWRLK